MDTADKRRNSTTVPTSRAVAVLFLYAALVVAAPLASGFSSLAAIPSRVTSASTNTDTDKFTTALYVSTSTRPSGDSSSGGSNAFRSSSRISSAQKASTTTTSSRSSEKQQQKQKSQATLEEELPWDWQAVVQHVFESDSRPVIMFDGECNLCNGGVNMLLDMDTNNVFRFCSLASKFGQSLLVANGKDPDDRNSIMVIMPSPNKSKKQQHQTTTKYYQKSQAIMAIASQLGGAPQWVKAMTAVGHVAPVAVSDWLLQIIADNRYRVAGEYDQCRLDLDGEYEGRFLNDYEHEELFQCSSKKQGSNKKEKNSQSEQVTKAEKKS